MIAFALLVSLLSCSKKEDSDIPVLLQTVIMENADCVCDPFISLYLWHGQKVYVLGYMGPACNWFPTFYDEDGREIAMGMSTTHFFDESHFIKTVWKCRR